MFYFTSCKRTFFYNPAPLFGTCTECVGVADSIHVCGDKASCDGGWQVDQLPIQSLELGRCHRRRASNHKGLEVQAELQNILFN